MKKYILVVWWQWVCLCERKRDKYIDDNYAYANIIIIIIIIIIISFVISFIY